MLDCVADRLGPAVRRLAASTAMLIAVCACSPATPPGETVGLDDRSGSTSGETGNAAGAEEPLSPSNREVAVITSGCGDAPGGIGSGVRLSPDVILTAAHVVERADRIWVISSSSLPPTRTWPEFSPRTLSEGRPSNGEVETLDRNRDLALVVTSDSGERATTGHLEAHDLGFVDLRAGEQVELHGVARPGAEPATVVERTRIIADGPRGSARAERLGYRLEASTVTGDSGAGLWRDNQLAGVVFAVSTANAGESWAVAGSEIRALLDEQGSFSDGPRYRCEPSRSRLEPTER